MTKIKGTRLNQGKLRIGLVSSFAIEGLAKHMQMSLLKYEEHNWAKGLDLAGVVESLERHILDLKRGILESTDEKTGFPYKTVDAIMFNSMVLSHFEHTGQWDTLDDNMEYNTIVGDTFE